MSSVAESNQASGAHVPVSARIERELLVALAFVLPLFEAPKNILWVALLAVWLVNRGRAQTFGGRWDHWDTLIAAWIGSGFGEIWRVGVAAWREFPAFGVGMGNFSRIETRHLESWSAKRGEAFDPGAFVTGPHGHSLFGPAPQS